ncbi:MAG TPA: DoxX family protein [Pseudonocardiaceae bacterium]|nr:DoxX family protein [Pseudonocardiaceae bacterium]
MLRLLTVRAPVAVTDAAFLALRLTLGVIFLAHGWDALNGMGTAGVVEAQRAAGIPLPEVAGPFTIYAELIGGVFLILGAGTRLFALVFTGIMLGAWGFIHAPNGIFVENGGFELVLALAAGAVVLAATGPGRFSVDHLIAGLQPSARETAGSPL